VRGTGFSQGHRDHDFAEDEVQDFKEIMDFVESQSWSNGQFGSLGFSYEGIVSEMLVAMDTTTKQEETKQDKSKNSKNKNNKMSRVKAIAPMFAPFDTFRAISHPGGLFPVEFFNHYEDFVRRLEHYETQTRESATLRLHAFGLNNILDGAAPVELYDGFTTAIPKEEAAKLKQRVIDDHVKNRKLEDMLKDYPFADSPIPLLNNKTIEDLDSPRIRALLQHESLGVYTVSSWYDSAFVTSAITRHNSLKSKHKKLLLGPWDHAAQKNGSPFSDTKNLCFLFYQELMRFFDFHLQPNLNPEKKFYTKEPAVRYYMIGAEEWRTSNNWPPEYVKPQTMFLNSDKTLLEKKSSETTATDSSVSYKVDFSVGPGLYARWNVLKHLSTRSINHELPLQKMLTFASQPLSKAMEIAGEPTLRLTLSVNAPDATVFAYLLDVDPSNKYTVITDGHLRLIHRKLYNESVDADMKLYRTFRMADAEPMPVNTMVSNVVIHLYPIAYRVKANHKIVLALSGWDKDNFDVTELKDNVATMFTIASSSNIELPLV